MERTLGIVKPDAVSKNLVGPVLAKANEAGLRIVAIKMLKLSKAVAEGFYYVHKERSSRRRRFRSTPTVGPGSARCDAAR